MDTVIGLGANQGDRAGTLRRAAREVAKLGALTAASSLYETAPIGPPQPDFLNAAIRLATSLEPERLLSALLDIERTLGRVRRERWGPRVIDLDVLWAEVGAYRAPGLELPHPRLTERAFALVPLLEVGPELTEPRSGARYAELAARLPVAGLRRVVGTEAGAWMA
ncbi:MAG: 2-amino-4-hydroxy-6-hydroxymethyldihydropteridine diphosphokinase [Sorangiineae bacterium]|nr:2-amino-4-hydroxy-6-hydroxymethyldihydropteridine diphosphokinase [Polyangiaceae bacterium]MEB2322605.1 2-amino-4-hydroxy-6-hydroxymethyldihydropteridine diphosphokinase [Sorangiineae bacterium]